MAMPTAGTAQGYFDATLPNRRVEKDELQEWLRIVGEQNFLDDLGADHGVEELWTNGRFRNAHLVANLTMAQLRDAHDPHLFGAQTAGRSANIGSRSTGRNKCDDAARP